MTGFDIAFGVLAGVISCLTPESLLLLPLLLSAAGAERRAAVMAPAVGLGLSLVLTGFVAGSFTSLTGIEFRRLVCALLFLQGIVLMSPSLVERYPRLTGGRGDMFARDDATSAGSAFRLCLLGIFVGANWLPLAGPTLVRASAMAADIWNSGLALVVLFAFGMGAAAPWIVLGRIVRLLLRPYAGSVLDGMAGKRLLGLSLLVVAIIGSTRLEFLMTHFLGGLLPDWTRKIATTF